MQNYKKVGEKLYETVTNGGIGIFRTDVGYAIIGQSKTSIEKIFKIKKRSFSKPCGCFGSWNMFQEIIIYDNKGKAFVDSIVNKHNLPLSIVAQYKSNHKIFTNADPYVIEKGTKVGTVDLLMNVGPIHDKIAELALQHSNPVFGSSANISLSGSKYCFNDIETELLENVDLAVNSGKTKYSDINGYGSTIIDIASFKPFRVGICFQEIRKIAKDEFNIEIPSQIKNA